MLDKGSTIILEDIAQRGTVFLVHMGDAADAGSVIGGLISATNEIVYEHPTLVNSLIHTFITA